MIPRTAHVLGLAGLLPFGFGAALCLFPMFGGNDATAGQGVLVAYGVVILCFMSGVLWGFAARSRHDAEILPYALSVVPALFVFFLATDHVLGLASEADRHIWALVLGFPGLLLLDFWFTRQGMTPDWWMTLRLQLTAGATLCLLVGALT